MIFAGNRSRVLHAFAVLWAMSFAIHTQAATMADKVPGDALVFVEWAGAEHLGEKYEASHLKAVLDQMGLKQILEEVVPALRKKLAGADDEVAQVMSIVGAIAEPVWKHPTAIYVGPIEGLPRRPEPRIALLCDAGKDAADLEQTLRDALKDAGDAPVEVKRYGTLVVMSFGRMPANVSALWGGPEAVAPAMPISQNPRFATAKAQVMKDAALTIYIDSKGLIGLVDEAVKGEGDDAREWDAMRKTLGVDGLNEIIITAGFIDKNWGGQAFIGAPAPRKGLVGALLNSKPLSKDMMSMIPASATVAGGGRLDFTAVISSVREVIGSVEPRAIEELNEGLEELKNEVLGVHIENELLKALGDEWVYYINPDKTGHSVLGIVLVNKLRDPELAEMSLQKIGKAVNKMIAKEERGDVQIRFRQGKIDGKTVNYFGIPLVAPSYVIEGDKLVLALYPQTAVAAATKPAKSIVDAEGYATLVKGLGSSAKNAKHSGFAYVDLPRTADTGYPIMMLIGRGLTGLSDMFGVQAPLTVPPTLDKLKKHLSPAGAVTIVDDNGVHIRSITPFPGATTLAGGGFEASPMLIAGSTAVLLPSLAKARATANMAASSSNLRQIGMGMFIYAADNRDQLPAALGDLTPAYIESPRVFISPRSKRHAPARMDKDKIKAWVNANSDYVFLLGSQRLGRLDSSTIMAHERMELGRDVAVLFADGSVRRMTTDRLRRLLDKQDQKD